MSSAELLVSRKDVLKVLWLLVSAPGCGPVPWLGSPVAEVMPGEGGGGGGGAGML